MDSYVAYLSALLLLGIALGCHSLAFRVPLKTRLGRALQRAGKLRMLGVAMLGPLSLLLWLLGSYPLPLLLTNQVMLYWVVSTLLDVIWLTGPAWRWDWRVWARLTWAAALTGYAGWLEPTYRDVCYALASSLLVLGLLWKALGWLFSRSLSKTRWLRQLQGGLRFHAHVLAVLLAGYFLLRAWTVVPITSEQLNAYELGLKLVVGLAIVELAAVFLEALLRTRPAFREYAHLLGDAVRGLLYTASALGLASSVFHRDLSQLVLSSAFFSVGLGFALKPTMGNLVSGLVLRLSDDFSIGDFLLVDRTFGLVTAIDWRSVRLGTLQGDAIEIPHRIVAESLLVNYSRPSRQHANLLEVKLSRSLPPGFVRAQLLQLLAEIPEVCPSPAPEVFLIDLNGWSCTYQIRWWMEQVGRAPWLDSAVRTRLMYGLQRENLVPVNPVLCLEQGPGYNERDSTGA